MTKLPLRERRYKALLNQIAKLTLARNKAIKTIVKAETTLPGLERRARRLEFPTVKAKAEFPALAEPTVQKGGLNHETQVTTRPPPPPPSNPPKPNGEPTIAKPKRVRKPKPSGEAPPLNSDDRKAKMEALGFRKL